MEKVFETQDDELKKVIFEEINKLGAERKLNSLEKPKDFFMTSEEFSPANDIVTPTFKLKRNVCKKVYQREIDEMYAKMPA